MRGAVAEEADQLNHGTPEGRRIRPPFFFESPFERSRAGELRGRTVADAANADAIPDYDPETGEILSSDPQGF